MIRSFGHTIRGVGVELEWCFQATRKKLQSLSNEEWYCLVEEKSMPGVVDILQLDRSLFPCLMRIQGGLFRLGGDLNDLG